MKQNEAATLPAAAKPARAPQSMPAHAMANAKTPVRAKAVLVENASEDADATSMAMDDAATAGPDLLITASENVPSPQGTAKRKPAADLLRDSAEVLCDSAEVLCDSAEVLCDSAEVLCDSAEVLCDSAEEQRVPAEKNKDGTSHERTKHRVQAGAQPSRRQLQEREREPKPELKSELELESTPDNQALESAATAWLLIAPDDPARPAGKPGKSGKYAKDKAGGASSERPDIAGSDSDIPVKNDDRPPRVSVVAHTLNQQLRPPKMSLPNAQPKLRPKSKAECERRCGSDGFCDPSDPVGCGGLHCGQRHNML